MSRFRGRNLQVNWVGVHGHEAGLHPLHYSLSRAERREIVDRNKRRDADAALEMRRLLAKYENNDSSLSAEARDVLNDMRYVVGAQDLLLRKSAKMAGWRRNKKKMLATPVWADLDAIDTIYEKCGAMNLEAGKVAFHVDHIVPLQGKLVSGLHVPANLRIIPKRDNIKKGNRFDESMLDDQPRNSSAAERRIHNP